MNILSQSELPKGAPIWENIKGGKIKATITMVKPGSKIFKVQQICEEIVGNDRAAMEQHVALFQAWLLNYDVYYSCVGWRYEVKWKG